MGKRARRIVEVLHCYRDDIEETSQKDEKQEIKDKNPAEKIQNNTEKKDNSTVVDAKKDSENASTLEGAEYAQVSRRADDMYQRIKTSIDSLKERLERHDQEIHRVILSRSVMSYTPVSMTNLHKPRQPSTLSLVDFEKGLDSVEVELKSDVRNKKTPVETISEESTTTHINLEFQRASSETVNKEAIADGPLPLQTISQAKLVSMACNNAPVTVVDDLKGMMAENKEFKNLVEDTVDEMFSKLRLFAQKTGSSHAFEKAFAEDKPNSREEKASEGKTKSQDTPASKVNVDVDSGIKTNLNKDSISDKSVVCETQKVPGGNTKVIDIPGSGFVGDVHSACGKSPETFVKLGVGIHSDLKNASGEKAKSSGATIGNVHVGDARPASREKSNPVNCLVGDVGATVGEKSDSQAEPDIEFVFGAGAHVLDAFSKNNNHPAGCEDDSDTDDSPVKIHLKERSTNVPTDGSPAAKKGRGYFLFPIGGFTSTPTSSPVVKWKDVMSIIPSGVRNHKNVDFKKFNRFEKQQTTISHGVPTSSYVRARSYAVRKIRPPVVCMEPLLEQNEKTRIFQETHAKFVCVNLMMALRFLHEHDIAHGSLCPRTIILNDKGYPCITGFDTAEIIHDRPSRPRARIDVEYSSSEQIYQDCISETTDTYSVGVLTYHMIYGQPPHRGKTLAETRRNALNNDFEPPFKPESISREGRKLITKCIRKYEDRRFNILHKKAGLFESVSWFSGLNEEKLYKQAVPSPLLSFVSKGPRVTENV